MGRRNRKRVQPATSAPAASNWQRWRASIGPFFRFGASFVGLIALLSAISLAPFFQSFVTKGVQFDARLVGKVLNWLGQETRSTGNTIISSRFAMTVLSECSASEFVTFLWAALLAFPTTWRRKVVGVLLGSLCVFLVNLVRLVTLFFVGVYRPTLFPAIHETVWPGLFSIAIIAFVVGWASWAARKLDTNAPA